MLGIVGDFQDDLRSFIYIIMYINWTNAPWSTHQWMLDEWE